MRKSRCLGLMGGLGIGATVLYYERIARLLERQERVPEIAMVHADTPQVFGFAEAKDRDGLARYLCGFIQRMAAAGAECVAIPAVTPLVSRAELMVQSSLPVIDLLEPVRMEIRSRGLRRVALFGTRFVVEGGLFGLLEGVEVAPPRGKELEEIHAIYLDTVRQGNSAVQLRSRLSEVAKRVIERESLDAIVLAGTDLTTLYEDDEPTFPVVDCARLHIAAIVEALM